MALSTLACALQTAAHPQVLPLENGDRLTRAEFERRYEAMPHLKKAKLIEGVVYVPSPVRYTPHGAPQSHIVTWLGTYAAATPGVGGADNTTVRLDLDNEPQPDALLIILPANGGQSRIDADGYIAGAPELVAEVTASSASDDLHAKLNAYRRNGVRKYLVWRVLEQAIDWFVLRDGQYEHQAPGAEGFLRSAVFPGLGLDPAALVRGDLVTVSAAVQQGIASLEHAALLTRLSPPSATS